MNNKEKDMSRNEAILKIKFWAAGRCGSFYTSLIDCIAKADHSNRIRLSKAFPELCKAFSDWNRLDDDLFKELENNNDKLY